MSEAIVTPAPCVICARNDWCVDENASGMLGLPPERRVIRCRSCGIRRLWPYLTDAELSDLYRGGYFGDDEDASGLAGVANPEGNYVKAYVVERLAKFERNIRRLRALNPTGRTLLDYGAATGEFVAIARAGGLEADGVEYSAHAVAVAAQQHGLQLHQGGIEAMPRRRFDFIHLHHVFEHLTEPVRDLRAFVEHLEPNGVLFIEIPYQFHVAEKAAYRIRHGRAPQRPTLHSYHHPFFYTPATLRRLVEDAGLEVLSLRCFIREDYPAHGVTGRVKRLAWNALDRFANIGNVIELVARAAAS